MSKRPPNGRQDQPEFGIKKFQAVTNCVIVGFFLAVKEQET